MIVASAIKLVSGRIFVGKRHGDCFENMHKILKVDKPLINEHRPICGFINDRLQFLNREEAYYEAFSCGQCKEQKEPNKETIDKINSMFPDNINNYEWKPQLASEDLW